MRRNVDWSRLVGWILALGLGMVVTVSGLAGDGFVQEAFAIGLWVPPRSDRDLPARYRELAQANFNLVVGNSVRDPMQQLELCRSNGLKALVEVSGSVESLPVGEACWGYHLMDEPSAAAFADLSGRFQSIRRSRPGLLAYVNLFPNYASAVQLGADDYEMYVSRFIAEVKPEVLCMDHYPFMRPDKDTRDSYLANLETFRRQANAARIPFWNYFNCMPFGSHLDPTESQLRWQINASIAHGAKGVLYFCYWTPGKGAGGKGEFPKGGAILSAEGIQTRHYDEARRLNGELKRWGPTLMNLDGNGVQRIRVAGIVSDLSAGLGLRGIATLAGDPPAEFLVGSLAHRDGRRAVMVVNHSYSYTCWPTIQFDSPIEAVLEVDRNTGSEMAPLDSSPEIEGFQCSLGAGDARLFLLPKRR